MAPTISNIADIQQNFMNNITQQDQQNCLAVNSTTADHNVIISVGGIISGNFTGVAITSNTDATCLMVSNMQDSVQNILSSTIQQTNKSASDIFSGLSFPPTENNSFDISQSITNNISQINNATCSASTITSASNNYIYLGPKTKIGGNFIGVTIDSDASANCSMTNTMKNTTYNQAQASGTQSNVEIGMFATIAAIIASMIGFIFIAVFVLYSMGALKHVGFSNPDGSAPQQSEEEKDLQAAQDLGITPDILQILLHPELST